MARAASWTLVAAAALAIVAALLISTGWWQWFYYDARGFDVGPPTETWPPRHHVASGGVRVAAVGDPGTGDAGEYEVTRTIAAEDVRQPYDALVLLGDLVYPHGDADSLDEAVLEPFAPILDESLAFFPVLGNHDYDSSEEEVILQSLGRKDAWYADRVGPVEVVVLDSNRADDPEQTAWLGETLRSTSAPWTVVALHHPPYSAGVHGSDEEVRDAWADLFAENGVELVLAGHDHDYQRSEPIDGVVYVVSGGVAKTQPCGRADFTAFSAGETLHFLDLQITRDRLLGQAIDTHGRAFDSFALRPRAPASGG
jgi:3',5'-cyclic AMP phosphodiesterase CpdA